MNKKDIDDFLASNPTEDKKKRVWERHLKEVGYKDGMLPCCCGCYGWGWGRSENGIFYLQGHAPKTAAPEEKRVEAKDPIWVGIISNIILFVLAVILVWAAISLPSILASLL